MWTARILCILLVAIARAQLNFDGNPLTEDTIYTAEESHLNDRTAKAQSLDLSNVEIKTEDSYITAAKSSQSQHPQKLHPLHVIDSENPLAVQKNQLKQSDISNTNIQTSQQQQNAVFVSPRPLLVQVSDDRLDQAKNQNLQDFSQPQNQQTYSAAQNVQDFSQAQNQQTYSEAQNQKSFPQMQNQQVQNQRVFPQAQNQQVFPQSQDQQLFPQSQDEQLSNPSESALVTFLESRTPEESQLALEEYLSSRQQQPSAASSQPYQPHISEIFLPAQKPVASNAQQQIYSIPPNQQYLQSLPEPSQLLQQDPVSARHTVFIPRKSYLGPGPYMPDIQARNDFPHAGRRPMYPRPLRRQYGLPQRFQPRIGAPGFFKGPHPPGLNKFKQPIEVIYTKPPGYKKPLLSNPPVPYEDAGAWFPDADHPPPESNVYWSQLYAQSYDPHYYNYIAKTGKIKPHLYGKLDKPDDGFLGEVFRSFKKHGLKKLMTPMFLLGLGIPTLTLMLSAFAHKRSLGRSDSGDAAVEEQIREYLERLQKAVEVHDEEDGVGEDKDG